MEMVVGEMLMDDVVTVMIMQVMVEEMHMIVNDVMAVDMERPSFWWI